MPWGTALLPLHLSFSTFEGSSSSPWTYPKNLPQKLFLISPDPLSHPHCLCARLPNSASCFYKGPLESSVALPSVHPAFWEISKCGSCQHLQPNVPQTEPSIFLLTPALASCCTLSAKIVDLSFFVSNFFSPKIWLANYKFPHHICSSPVCPFCGLGPRFNV